MKKLFILLFAILSFSFVYAQKGTANYLSEKRGFKCFKLGAPISIYKDIVTPTKDNPNTYSVTDSTLFTIGNDIKLRHIFIKTFNDSVYSVSLMAKPEYRYKIKNVLIAAFGAWSFQPNKYIERYYWVSSDQKIELLLDCNYRQWCIVTYKDLEIDLKKGKLDFMKDKKAADDL